jgi:hypothetical protein
MYNSYFEDLIQAETREADRRMLFLALRSRRTSLWPRNLLTALFWLLGVTR